MVVREYARLTTAGDIQPSLDLAQVSPSAFDWLCRESARLAGGRGAALVQVDDGQRLRLDNYVGVLEAPCGTVIEILPKTTEGPETAGASRAMLRRMLRRCLRLPARESAPTHLHAVDAPPGEWVMAQFLDGLRALVKRGIRYDYHRVREAQRFLRGRLDLPRQLRQTPDRQHQFHIEHDVFDADRAENRLLRSALDRVRRHTRDPDNRRLARELGLRLAEVPPSRHIDDDFRRWRGDRLMAHYGPLRPWCALILNERDPESTVGDWQGTSLLFPMERVFERYVEACLRDALPPGAEVRAQAVGEHLCRHGGGGWFRLLPDFLLRRGDLAVVLDTKWKRLDAAQSGSREKYGLQQSDFYQLFAYGQRYLKGQGDLMLVYPRTHSFQVPLPVFEFSDTLRLWVVPFDLEAGTVVLSASTLPPAARALFQAHEGLRTAG